MLSYTASCLQADSRLCPGRPFPWAAVSLGSQLWDCRRTGRCGPAACLASRCSTRLRRQAEYKVAHFLTATLCRPERSVVSTENAPAAVGPYSQAVRAGNVIYLSGQLGLVPGVRVPGIAQSLQESMSRQRTGEFLAALLTAADYANSVLTSYNNIRQLSRRADQRLCEQRREWAD